MRVGERVTVGHRVPAWLYCGVRLFNRDGCNFTRQLPSIHSGSIIGAGSVVTSGTTIPSGVLALGLQQKSYAH